MILFYHEVALARPPLSSRQQSEQSSSSCHPSWKPYFEGVWDRAIFGCPIYEGNHHSSSHPYNHARLAGGVATVSMETIIARSVWLLLFRIYFSSLLHPVNTPNKLQLKTLIICFLWISVYFFVLFCFPGGIPTMEAPLNSSFCLWIKELGVVG